MPAHEHTVAETWLYATLQADSTLSTWATGGFWSEIGPDDDTPIVMWALQTSGDSDFVAMERVYTTLDYQVKTIALGRHVSDGQADAARRIDDLIHGQSGTAAGGRIVNCRRLRPFSMLERSGDNKYFRHLGGIYRAVVQDTA